MTTNDGKCIKCGLHEEFDGNKCNCKNGFLRNDKGVCELQCGLNEVVKDYKCVCALGFEDDGYGKCIPDCKKYERWDGK